MGMPTSDQVYETLRGVIDPELGADIVELGMVSNVDLSQDGAVAVGIALTIAACPLRGQIERDVTRRLESLPGITSVQVSTTAMDQAQRSKVMEIARLRARQTAGDTRVPAGARVAAVASGKGGVGKSSIAVNLAASLAAMGYSTGLLDADIWGFSVPRMLGVTERLQANDEKLIIPVESHGVKVVSTGLIIETEETALMWRGLMLSKALDQFLNQVNWGPLDYLVIDMPPGTGDVQMALARLLPQAEMLVVTTPQVAAQKVAVRVADMARRSHMPILGVVENMSEFVCDHGSTYLLFGEGGGAQLASEISAPLLGSIPLDQSLLRGGDSGTPVVLQPQESPAKDALANLANRLVELIPPVTEQTCTGRMARLITEITAT